MAISEQQAIFIEEAGLAYEQFGLPRMAGRILGYLLICQPDYASFDDLVSQLQASKGAVSQNLLLLTNQTMVERVPVPNDRRTYYRFSESRMFEVISSKSKSIAVFTQLFQQAQRLTPVTNNPRENKLSEIIEFYEWLTLEMEALSQRWQQKLLTKK